MKMKKIALACAAAGLTLLGAGQAQAANWLMLQGTEPAGSAGRAKVWGFIQAQYQKDFSDKRASDGNMIPPKLIGPDLESQSAFNVNRARIGVRGANFPLSSKTNYFILAEFGNNAITSNSGSFAHLTDASVTLNYIPGARVRLGLFKTPGAEEGLQAIHVFDYINFTTVSNQLLLERNPSAGLVALYRAAGRPGALGTPNPGVVPLNVSDQPVSAFRDVGIQVFDTFKRADWEHSYALMMGNGNGLNFTDNNSDKDVYAYWSSEKVFGGKGPRREGLKMFAWYQTGKRSFDGNGDGVLEKYDRKRMGLGFKYLKKPFRLTAEYMRGEGMIFMGPNRPDYAILPPDSTNENGPTNGLNGKANGWYVEGGWYIPGTKWEIDARYDVYNRLTDKPATPAGYPVAWLRGHTAEMQFQTATIGAQYHLNKKTRINMEYSFRDFEAVDLGSGVGFNSNLDGVKGRAAIQVTAIY